MEDSLLVRLHRSVGHDSGPCLRTFVTAAFVDLLKSCPGLAERLFGDIGPLGPEPEVWSDVAVSADSTIDVLLAGRDGFHLLIENRLAEDLEWYEERTEHRPPSRTDAYVAAARHRWGGCARVLVLARTTPDLKRGRHPSEVLAGARTWASLDAPMREAALAADSVCAHLIRQFLELMREHDMNPNERISSHDVDTILAFDRLARNNLKVLDDAIARIRQEFDLKSTPNNRRLTGWYACSDRFQSGEVHLFFYLMFPPVPELVLRAAVQVSKESSPKSLAAAAENGFRRGRWGSLWVERDFRKQHPFLELPPPRQLEELVKFFQAPLARLSKAGWVKAAPVRHEEAPRAKSAEPPVPSVPAEVPAPVGVPEPEAHLDSGPSSGSSSASDTSGTSESASPADPLPPDTN